MIRELKRSWVWLRTPRGVPVPFDVNAMRLEMRDLKADLLLAQWDAHYAHGQAASRLVEVLEVEQALCEALAYIGWLQSRGAQ